MKKIVIVEDEIYMREELENMFLKENYKVFCITSFTDTAKNILQESPDLVLLDLNLPGATGFDICKELKHQCEAPVLILTSRVQLRDELLALNLGADEYLVKPCHKEILLLRAANLLRRFEGRRNLLDGRGFLLDRQTYTLYCDDKSLHLPENQGKIMVLLLQHLDEVVMKDTLSQLLWGTTQYIDENAIQVNITRLKKTLRSMNLDHRIITVRGAGYQLISKTGTD